MRDRCYEYHQIFMRGHHRLWNKLSETDVRVYFSSEIKQRKNRGSQKWKRSTRTWQTLQGKPDSTDLINMMEKGNFELLLLFHAGSSTTRLLRFSDGWFPARASILSASAPWHLSAKLNHRDAHSGDAEPSRYVKSLKQFDSKSSEGPPWALFPGLPARPGTADIRKACPQNGCTGDFPPLLPWSFPAGRAWPQAAEILPIASCSSDTLPRHPCAELCWSAPTAVRDGPGAATSRGFATPRAHVLLRQTPPLCQRPASIIDRNLLFLGLLPRPQTSPRGIWFPNLPQFPTSISESRFEKCLILTSFQWIGDRSGQCKQLS